MGEASTDQSDYDAYLAGRPAAAATAAVECRRHLQPGPDRGVGWQNLQLDQPDAWKPAASWTQLAGRGCRHGRLRRAGESGQHQLAEHRHHRWEGDGAGAGDLWNQCAGVAEGGRGRELGRG
ncbi:hypothetical protein G6F62_013605 [Rhizopus arrhizus]|nr:hypothetical protein G6F62_013605 [Rhizopus arrhizus]